jgi:hypothetical protein
MTTLDLHNLYDRLRGISEYELGGEYNPKTGFIIDDNATRYDEISRRPYTVLNMRASSGIVWHSHPFDYIKNRYPSIEDANVARHNPHLVFLLITEDGIYVMRILDTRYSVYDIVRLYRKLESRGNVELAFQSGTCSRPEYYQKYGLYCYFIPIEKITETDYLHYINREIARCKSINKISIL